MSRQYYSMRTGKNPFSKGIDLNTLKRLFSDLYKDFDDRDYFQEAFGYDCVDAGYVPGNFGLNIDAQIFFKIRKDDLWPILEKCEYYSEDDLFDIIELLFDNISKPVDGYYHEFGACGWHYHSFDSQTGKVEYREKINLLLNDYEAGFKLSENGEILILGDSGLEKLFSTDIPSDDNKNIVNRIQEAINKFRRYKSTLENRRDAIRDLADVIEYLRPTIKEVLTNKDENDLFNIANNFGIRHHNEDQKSNYDKSVWYSWIFYYYLATIYAILHLQKKSK